MQYPAFYTPELQTLAIVPFENRTQERHAGEIVSDKLAAVMRANGSYQVFNRGELTTLLEERDLQIAFGSDSAAAAGKFRELGKVQALLTGTVTNYSATSEQRQETYYLPDRNGNMQAHHKIVTHNEGNVSVSAALVRVSDGATIYATPQPAVGQVASNNGIDCRTCVDQAADQAVQLLMETFTPVRKEIKIKQDALQVASGSKYDGKWPKAKEFAPSDTDGKVVLALPVACDRNRFRLVIARKDAREDLLVQQVDWTRDMNEYVWSFSPAELASKSGMGEFEAKFYAGESPALTQKFQIRQPK